MKKSELIILTVILVSWNPEVRYVSGHGRIMEPPGRSSMWRFGYPTPVNYDDNQLWCGGAANFTENGRKCGICGDNFADSNPREHEAGGKYGLGLVSRRYAKGQLVEAVIELTANHRGYFEFRICPVPDSTKEVTQECLNQNKLKVMDDNGNLQDNYPITRDEKNVSFDVRLQLPTDLLCTHCVVQWTYIAANSWGICENGTEANGCGPQETFVNCADIAILANDGTRPPHVPPKNMVLVRDNKSGELIPLVVRSQVCMGNGSFKTQPGIDMWCQENCVRYPPNCPEDKCMCIDSCEPQGEFRNVTGAQLFCDHNCIRFPQINCDPERCKCY